DRSQASATFNVGPKRALLRFERLPASYIHPDRLSGCLSADLPAKYRDRLLEVKRLRLRLSDVLTRRFSLVPCVAEDLDTPEGRFALLEGAALDDAIRRIGAVWNARTIAAIILADCLKELVAWLGRDGYRQALRHVKLAPADVNNDVVGDKPDIELLCKTIERDGQYCVNAWCEHQPAFLARRILLKLPPIAEIDDQSFEQFQDQGLLITDRVIMEIMADDGNGNS
ncbi:MAG: SctK family type III secretion system sorting platform protein, partial [Geminicoccaceae bacterium]